eukprot:3769870-Prymnesium_polylepis.1
MRDVWLRVYRRPVRYVHTLGVGIGSARGEGIIGQSLGCCVGHRRPSVGAPGRGVSAWRLCRAMSSV